MEAKAIAKYVRMSPIKLKPVTDLVRGKDLNEALTILKFTPGKGAEIIEKHITIDRHMKGTDQPGSLGPDGVNRMVRDIRMVERWMGTEDLYIDKSVAGSQATLERSIAWLVDLTVCEVITEEQFPMVSPG